MGSGLNFTGSGVTDQRLGRGELCFNLGTKSGDSALSGGKSKLKARDQENPDSQNETPPNGLGDTKNALALLFELGR